MDRVLVVAPGAVVTSRAVVHDAVRDRFTPDSDHGACPETWRLRVECDGVHVEVSATGYGDAEGLIGSRVVVRVDGESRSYRVLHRRPRRAARRAANEVVRALGYRLPRVRWCKAEMLATMAREIVDG